MPEEFENNTDDDLDSIASDDIRVEAEKVPGIFVKKEITFDESGNIESVTFSVNNVHRPDTSLSGIQGDHSISYVSILEAILSLTDKKRIMDSAKSFRKFAKKALSPNNHEIDEIEEPKVYKSGVRKKASDILLGAGLSAEELEQFQLFISSAKKGKVDDLVDYLCKLVDCFLRNTQKEDLATFYNRGRKNKPGSDKEKRGSGALAVLNYMIKLSDMNVDDFAEISDDFLEKIGADDDVTRDPEFVRKINYWKLNGNKTADKLCNKIKKELTALDNSDDEILDNDKYYTIQGEIQDFVDRIFKEKQDEMAGFIGNLLDYRRDVVFDLDESVKLADGQSKKSKVERDQIRQNKLKDWFSPQDHDHVLNNGKLTITRKNTEDLVKIIAKYSLVFSAAFPDLDEALISQNIKDKIIDKFLENILENQGWKGVNGLNCDKLKKAVFKAVEKPASKVLKPEVVKLKKNEEIECAIV